MSALPLQQRAAKKNPSRLLPFIFQHKVQDQMHRSAIVLKPGQPNYPIKGCGSRIFFAEACAGAKAPLQRAAFLVTFFQQKK